jgi:hypothetical protein
LWRRPRPKLGCGAKERRKKKELTPWSRVLLEKLTVNLIVKKLAAFYGNRRFITVFTKARHWPLYWTFRGPLQHFVRSFFFFTARRC